MKADEIREAAQEYWRRPDPLVGQSYKKQAFEAGARWALERVRKEAEISEVWISCDYLKEFCEVTK